MSLILHFVQVAWRQEIYAKHKTEDFLAISAPSSPNALVPAGSSLAAAAARAPAFRPTGPLQSGFKLMVSRMFGYV